MAKKGTKQNLQVFVYQGIDRSSTELLNESTLAAKEIFPVIQTAQIMVMNMNDDLIGGLTKRPGCQVFLNQPNSGNAVQFIGQFITKAGNATDLMKSGTNLYAQAPNGSTWGSAVLTLTDSTHHLRAIESSGYMFLTNGIDPFMMYDGTRFYNIVNSCVSATLSSNLAAGDTTMSVNAISYSSTTGLNFPPTGFIQNGTEIIQYLAVTLNGSNQIIQFNNLIRGYANTVAQSNTSGTSLPITYGNPPITPKYLTTFSGRIYVGNMSGYPNFIGWTAHINEPTDPFNWIENSATPAAQAAFSNFTFDYIYNGDQIFQIIESNHRLIVIQSGHAHMIIPDNYGNPSGAYELDDQYGTSSPESVINLKGNCYWLNTEAIQRFDGQNVLPISTPIGDLIKGILTSNLPNIVSATFGYKIYWSVGQVSQDPKFGLTTYTNLVHMYNFVTGQFFCYTFPFTITAMGTMFDANGKKQLYFGDSQGNTYVFNPNSSSPIYNDAGNDINAYFVTKYLFGGDPMKRKKFKKIAVISDGGSKGDIKFSMISAKRKTDYGSQVGPTKNFVTIPNYVEKKNMPTLSSWFYGISAWVGEVSQSPFTFYGFELETEYQDGG